jgi:CheY-like chemotaxis protein
MRLNRAVHVTCQDEGKKAVVVIIDPDVEVDTLVIDALIEPLLHLLKNAVVHGIERPERRRLLGKPEEGRITVGLASGDGMMRISVEDDGRGISIAPLIDKAIHRGIVDLATSEELTDEDAFQLIFERGLTTAKNVTLNAGRGVGMSIVRESIENRGGHIEVASEPQQGTKFTLTFPVVSGSPGIDQPPDAAAAKPLILIVDDSNSIRLVTSRIVETLGCKAITAENGKEALELLLERSARPDLILSDVEMPVMDGWQFVEKVKTTETLRNIPVVMVTSLSDDSCKRRARDLGADDYHVKPLELKDFERVLRTFIATSVA